MESAIAVMLSTILSVFRMVVFPSKKMIVDLAYLRVIVRVKKLAPRVFLVITWTSIRVDLGNVTVHLRVKVVRRVLNKYAGSTMKHAIHVTMATFYRTQIVMGLHVKRGMELSVQIVSSNN